MRKKYQSMTLVLVAALCMGDIAPSLAAPPSAPTASNESLPMALSESDYADLRAYMNRARETLEETLKSSQDLGGTYLYRRLYDGIRAALEYTKAGTGLIDIRNEKLLFAAVLNRALVINDIYMKGVAIDRPSSTVSVAASTVLLASVFMALNYYKTSDNPRFETKLVPSPDWLVFARDTIPVFLRMSSMAPTKAGRREIVLSLLQWVQADLNRMASRRDYASTIVNLGTMRNEVMRDLRTVEEGQQALENVANQIAAATAPRTQPNDPKAPNGSEDFPSRNYPAHTSTGPEYSFFPKITLPLAKPAALDGIDDFSIADGDFSQYSGGFHTDGFRTGGVGGGVLVGDGSKNSGAGGYLATEARAYQMLLWQSERGTVAGVYASSGLFDAKAKIGSTVDGIPVYNFRFNGTINWIPGLIGVWFAIEANKFRAFSDQAVRLGGSVLSIPVVIGEKSYMFAQVTVGASWTGGGPNQQPIDQADFSMNFRFLLRASKFVISFENTTDFSTELSGYRRSWRNDLSLTLAIPLKFIFPNDGIRIQGNYRYYGELDGKPSVHMIEAGGYYELRF